MKTHPSLGSCRHFHCDIAVLASILHLGEVEVWTLIVAGKIAPVAKLADGRLVFDAASITARHPKRPSQAA